MKLTTTTSNSFERVSESFCCKQDLFFQLKRPKQRPGGKKAAGIEFKHHHLPTTTHNQLTSPPAPQYDLSDLRRGRRWRDGGETKKKQDLAASLPPTIPPMTYYICIYNIRYICFCIYIYIYTIYIHTLLEHV